jgi:pseudaminic acid biosynthesis-associated methylase
MDENLEIWKGEFGDKYTERCANSDENIESRTELFFEIMNKMRSNPKSIAEIGAGGGANLRAIRRLLGRGVELTAVEPNQIAREKIIANHDCDVARTLYGSAGDIPLADASIGLVFTSGVLIHIPPEKLGKALDEIHRVSSRWIVAIEYFNPYLIGVSYREEDKMLWKGDYGSMYLDRFPDLRCIGYGFSWKRETGLDNVTWWIFEKNP